MLFFRKLTAISVIAIAGVAFSSACSDDDDSAADGAGATGNSSSGGNGTGNNGAGGDGTGNTGTGGTINLGGDGPTGAAGDGAAAGPTIIDGEAFCGDVACQCSDGIDNDDDGDADGFDVECQGPLDNDESTFATGIPGDNRDESWADCFFDGDSGAGNDGCKYRYECLTGELPLDDPNCQVTQECLDFCGARTPNGCDCFGCCTIQLDSGESLEILTSGTCSIEQIDDPDVCIRCFKTDVCENTCGDCELCPGRTVDDLPDTCTPDPPAGGAPGDPPPGYTCDGADVCSDTIPCDSGYYCSLGCCIPVIK